MPRPLEEMPLFPLGSVLFPFASLQLHIFEERYREMIKMCLDEDRAFGIALIRQGQEVGGQAEPCLIGTSARIDAHHIYEDGRMDIRVRGEGRFRIRSLDDSLPWLVGMVEPVVEEDWERSGEALETLDRAREVGESYVTQLFSRFDFKVAQVKLHEDPMVLSFILSDLIQSDNRVKQRLLEITSTPDRLAELLPLLESLIEKGPQGPTKLNLDELISTLCDN